MSILVIILLIGLIAVILFLGSTEERPASRKKQEELDNEGWEYGDVWQQGSPDEPVAEDDTEYISILRGETGRGFSDTTMQEFIFYLGSKGIRAKYDSHPLEQVQVYVLKVEAGKAQEAQDLLNEKFSEERNQTARKHS